MLIQQVLSHLLGEGIVITPLLDVVLGIVSYNLLFDLSEVDRVALTNVDQSFCHPLPERMLQ